ncbi:MAG TPA: glycosyltransferase family 2 protein [Puia sp.]|jgi:glycosyltransferase|nr:glycosyltransferase family 2 protein [Puia sp.]
MMPRISIVTATFNSAATIRETLDCIRRQDYPNIEHIVVDGVSKDDTLKIIGEFPHLARVISEKDNGIYDAMNKGITLAGGDIVGILNSDDIYVDDHVLATIAAVFEDPNIDVCYADLQYVDQHDVGKVLRTWKAGKFLGNAFYWGWMPPHPTFFVRKSVYEKTGLFNTALKSSADYELMLRMLVKYSVSAAYIPQVLVRMRAGGMSNASVWNRIKANKEDRMAWKLNGLKPYFFTLYLKPLRKIHQFILK